MKKINLKKTAYICCFIISIITINYLTMIAYAKHKVYELESEAFNQISKSPLKISRSKKSIGNPFLLKISEEIRVHVNGLDNPLSFKNEIKISSIFKNREVSGKLTLLKDKNALFSSDQKIDGQSETNWTYSDKKGFSFGSKSSSLAFFDKEQKLTIGDIYIDFNPKERQQNNRKIISIIAHDISHQYKDKAKLSIESINGNINSDTISPDALSQEQSLIIFENISYYIKKSDRAMHLTSLELESSSNENEQYFDTSLEFRGNDFDTGSDKTNKILAGDEMFLDFKGELRLSELNKEAVNNYLDKSMLDEKSGPLKLQEILNKGLNITGRVQSLGKAIKLTGKAKIKPNKAPMINSMTPSIDPKSVNAVLDLALSDAIDDYPGRMFKFFLRGAVKKGLLEKRGNYYFSHLEKTDKETLVNGLKFKL